MSPEQRDAAPSVRPGSMLGFFVVVPNQVAPSKSMFTIQSTSISSSLIDGEAVIPLHGLPDISHRQRTQRY